MSDLVHRRLRAPQEDGAALIDPPLSQAGALIAKNQACGKQFDSLADFRANFRAAARRGLLVAIAHGKGTDPDLVNEGSPLILSGHQPDLFHPGVWVKNFVISSVAQAVGASAIHLIVDNDTIQSAAIRVPTGKRQADRVAMVEMDAATEEMPWEDRQIVDLNVFRNFSSKVHQAYDSVRRDASPLILDELWPHAIEAAVEQAERARELDEEVSRNLGIRASWKSDFYRGAIRLGSCLCEGRHRVERSIGLKTSEFPISLFGLDSSFLAFGHVLLTRHREFHAVHNQALREYRFVNGVRSQSHPVPELSQDGDWFEVPYWLWTGSDPRRRPAFVRNSGRRWELSDREQLVFSPPSSPDELAFALVQHGIKLRPRALVTTMYARLVLSDLFVHGIGGAKYDELTDEIIRRFFGFEPPKYVTATATFRLPIERPQVTADDVRACARQIRDCRYHPESLLRDRRIAADVALRQPLESLAAEKREYLAGHDLRRCPPHVFAQLDLLNRAMHALLQPVELELRNQHASLIAEWKRSQLLSSREFSFVLFPEKVSARLLDLSALSS